MYPITFVDTEIESTSGKILDIGAIKDNGSSFHKNSLPDFVNFLRGTTYVCGHNIFDHDLKYIQPYLQTVGVIEEHIIDTLYFSPLLFPKEIYHSLLKEDKLHDEDLNNPLNDSIKARELFDSEVSTFHRLHRSLKRIYYGLLHSQRKFAGFFRYIDYKDQIMDLEQEIKAFFATKICSHANLTTLIAEHPIELAYTLALIHTDGYSIIPPWVIKNFPNTEKIMYILRNKPCLQGCAYCNDKLDIHKSLKEFFGYDSYRSYGGRPLQEMAVRAAVQNKSLLAVFPTGGGKSITFQVPALISGRNVKGLTVVISPLQSLMKDQVDNLERIGITDAVTINGLLDPIERAKSIERVENGTASILYIAPESLRSKTIENLLLSRNVVRFVIDEAHCFSSWGQDFRVDYLFIGDFIKSLQEKKNLEESIPVSCFTATAKKKVIEDICNYFKEKLNLDMEIFSSTAERTNLRYKVIERNSEDEKYHTLRELLEQKSCPTIIYVSRTRKAVELAERLTSDGYIAKAYHGKMDTQEKTKTQDAFIKGEVQIMVATSAFGMGVDKKDVGMVIHFDISDSLENYIQEAGRAGRDQSIMADCYVLYNDDDLNNHFVLHNQSKLSIQEIQQIWKAIKELTKFRSKVSQSALEIARKAGWNEGISELETRVKTAIAALEDAGYIKRGQNMPRVYANSILAKNIQEAQEKINRSSRFSDKQKEQAVRIMKKLISKKSRRHLGDEMAESRIDYISDHLGIPKQEVIEIIHLLREERILADAKDLVAYIKNKDNINRSLGIVKSYIELERFLLNTITEQDQIINLKELNELAEKNGCKNVTINKIKTILNFWSIKSWTKHRIDQNSKTYARLTFLINQEELLKKLETRNELSTYILEYLFEQSKNNSPTSQGQEEVPVEFSILEVQENYNRRMNLFVDNASFHEVEETIFYLSKIEAIKIEGGFMVVYNALTIERLELDNKIRYKVEDYQKLNQFYQNKIQQIHIVGEYARKMIEDYKAALQFVNDYFQMVYSAFIQKYFKASRQDEIRRNITPAKFKQLFGDLSPSQLSIINDKDSKYIVVAAGPGSGKTRILVHKLASLLLMEDVKHEQLLMLTFSRAAVTEFKKRLQRLIGASAHFVEIKTFHSYCFDLMGKVGNLEKSDNIIHETVTRIQNGEVEPSRITKTVLVIDEAQDMDANEFALVSALIDQNEEMRVIAVGDDDQNIFEFRGSSSRYLLQLIKEKQAKKYELVENYRSQSSLVAFANHFVSQIPNRLKSSPIRAFQNEMGMIRLVRYYHGNLITPLVNDILNSSLTGSTCVLTKTNDEAIRVVGLLLKRNIQAKLIQSNDSFNLYNLEEIRFFVQQLDLTEDMHTISDDQWEEAKRRLKIQYRKSLNLDLVLNLLNDFELTSPKVKYISDFLQFIDESKLEDFVRADLETIFVSTIHKAKGREFDNVFLLLDQFYLNTDQDKRLLYVAITRAKSNLIIHTNGNYFDSIKVDGLSVIIDANRYDPPEHIALQLTFRDVWLDSFLPTQALISRLCSGDELIINDEGCTNHDGNNVFKFSKRLQQVIKELKQSNYCPTKAIIRYIVYWRKEDEDNQIKVILPELQFEKAH